MAQNLKLSSYSEDELYRMLLLSMVRNKLGDYKPYPKQFEFHELGLVNRERLLMAGNQEGKTYSGAMEVAFHLTGDYPDWWPGRRFNRPILAWTGSESNETSREIIQFGLLGTESADRSNPAFGTGAIPANKIRSFTVRQAGVRDVIDQIVVAHKSGGYSRVLLKVYEQGWQKFTGKKVDVVWLDEEPPQFKIYSECVTRTQAADNGILFLTFTPLNGMSDVVSNFMDPEGNGSGAAQGTHAQKTVINMTIYDCVGGFWPAGTPWAGLAWKGHYTKPRADAIVAAYPKHERRTRALGVPMMGEGMVWPYEADDFTVSPFEIPKFWPQIGSVDFGVGQDHPFAYCKQAWDRDNDIVYLTFCWRSIATTPVTHCDTIKRVGGDWMPVAWPHDGDNPEKSTGAKLVLQYRKLHPMFLPFSARYAEVDANGKEKGGAMPVEPIVSEMITRIEGGRFKIFSTCGDWAEEQRMFHRKQGKIVAIKDDVIKAQLYGLMELRHARVKPEAYYQRKVNPMLTQWGQQA